ncbi:MAG: PQQ-dependent sugar dehydrogenase [Kofleriaceae bacterium]|nr:PQQ-dependent sugar dehydrogenase [Kofleriaceae bacterium]
MIRIGRTWGCVALWLAACKTAPSSESQQSAPGVVAPGLAPRLPAAAGSGSPVATPAQAPPSAAKLTPVPASVAANVMLRKVITGLSRPVLVTSAPSDCRPVHLSREHHAPQASPVAAAAGDAARLFIVEQTGRVRVWQAGKLLAQAMLDVSKEISDGNEQGLLGLAFHPRFACNRKLYIYLTDRAGTSRVFEFTVDAANANVVLPASRREVLVVKQPYSNHNGGHLAFGPDGKLYVGLGDGGAGGDPKGNGQNPTALLGKLIRLDVDAATTTTEIVHLGLRNPWRFAFDATNGDLFIGDVGQNLWEQVYAVAGTDTRNHNFGWNVVEGNHCYDSNTCDRRGFTPPIADYPHDDGCSITGGVVYRGKALPALTGHYFYADFCTSLLRSLTWQPAAVAGALGQSTGTVTAHWDWKAQLDRKGELSQISSFGTNSAGEILIVSLTGTIWQLVPAVLAP